MRAVSVLFLPVAAWAAANANAPHPHTGLLSKYQAKTPESYGISLAGATAEQLRSGKPTVRFIDTGGGNKRVVSIQDIRAPEELVWRIITDLPNYSKMVEGCELCERYGEVEQLPDGGRVECAKYRIGAVGFKMEYFIKHTCAPPRSRRAIACPPASSCPTRCSHLPHAPPASAIAGLSRRSTASPSTWTTTKDRQTCPTPWATGTSSSSTTVSAPPSRAPLLRV